MSHGWLPRGDMSKPEVAMDVKKIIFILLSFISYYIIIYIGGERREEDDGESARIFCQKSLMQINRHFRS